MNYFNLHKYAALDPDWATPRKIKNSMHQAAQFIFDDKQIIAHTDPVDAIEINTVDSMPYVKKNVVSTYKFDCTRDNQSYRCSVLIFFRDVEKTIIETKHPDTQEIIQVPIRVPRNIDGCKIKVQEMTIVEIPHEPFLFAPVGHAYQTQLSALETNPYNILTYCKETILSNAPQSPHFVNDEDDTNYNNNDNDEDDNPFEQNPPNWKD